MNDDSNLASRDFLQHPQEIAGVLARLRTASCPRDSAQVLGELRPVTRLNNLELYFRGYSFASGLVFAHRQEAANLRIAREHGLRCIPEVVGIFQDGESCTGVLVKRFPGCNNRPAVPVLESGCVTKAMLEDLRAGLAALLARGLYPADALQSHDNWYVDGDQTGILVVKFMHLPRITDELGVRAKNQLDMLLMHPRLQPCRR